MPNERIRKLRELIAQSGGQALLVSNGVNRRYLTGFTGTAGWVVVTAAEAALFTDFRYKEQAPLQAPGFEIVIHGPDPNAAIGEWLNKRNIVELQFEERSVTYAAYSAMAGAWSSVKLIPGKDKVEQLRMFKDAGELAVMEAAAGLADRAFAHILDFIKPGVSEKAIAFELETFMRAGGASGPSFDTIVASGERSALPHGVAGPRIVGNGEFVKLDFGAYYEGYCSDITRTVFVGKPTDRHREIYGIVREAQQYALDHLRPGMTGKEGDALTRDIIARYGYGEYFGHGTGHSLGMEIHEAPRLSVTGDIAMAPGMTMTVEPGIYLPGFGGVRIEDDVVFTEEGVRLLTFSTKEFIVLD